MPVRRVQEAGGQDGRAQGGQGRCEEQLEGDPDAGELCAYLRPRKADKDAIDDSITKDSLPITARLGQMAAGNVTVVQGRPKERHHDNLHARRGRGGTVHSAELSTSLYVFQSVQILHQSLLDNQTQHPGGILLDND